MGKQIYELRLQITTIHIYINSNYYNLLKKKNVHKNVSFVDDDDPKVFSKKCRKP